MAASPQLLSVLRFKHLSVQLSDSEYDIFVSKLWRRLGKEQFSHALCALHMQKQWAVDRVNVQWDVADMMGSMCDIVSEIRKNRESERNPCTAFDITNLPSSLVGEVASYLSQKSYIALSMTNRKIAVDCNSPNRLQQLNLNRNDTFTEYTHIPMEQFTQIKAVRFKLEHIAKLQIKSGRAFRACNQLQTMIIDGRNSKQHHIDLFINDLSRCFASIQSLSLCHFGSRDRATLDSLRFMKMLAKFEALEHLKLFLVNGTDGVFFDQIQSICPRITSFAANGSLRQSISPFLISLCPQLDSLCVDGCSLQNVSIANCDVSGLKRLCLSALKMPKVRSLLFSNKTLREISWIPNINTTPAPRLKAHDVEDTVKRILIEQPLLEFLYVSTRGHLEAICNGIHRGMFMIKKRKRKQFEIALDVDVREISNAEELLCGITRIIHALGMCNIEEWMICVDAHCRQRFDWDPMEKSLRELVKSCLLTITVRGNAKRFIISKDCTKYRHSKWWQRGLVIPYY